MGGDEVSNRLKFAISYGVASILTLGIAAGVSLAGGDAVTHGGQWVAFVTIQMCFLFVAMGYTAGRDDQRKGLVREPPAL